MHKWVSRSNLSGMSTRHALTILAVEDLQRALAFYSAAFGWPQVVNVPVYAELALPEGMRLGLYQREGFGRNTGRAPARLPPGEIAPTELYFYPDDLEEAIQRLLAAGARKLSELAARDWGDEAAYFADPEGNVLVLARPLEAGVDGTPAGMRALAERWMKLWESDDLACFDELHAADFVDRSPAGRPADREAFREGIRELRRAFPDFLATETEVLVDAASKKVTVRWSATGTHRGTFLGVAASSRVVRFNGIELIRVERGKIAERWGEWDGLGLLEQLRAPARPDP